MGNKPRPILIYKEQTGPNIGSWQHKPGSNMEKINLPESVYI